MKIDDPLGDYARKMYEPLEAARKLMAGIQLPAFPAAPVLPQPFNLKLLEDPNHAKAFRERLEELVRDFEQSLDDAHDVGATIANFGQAVTIYVESIGYWNPSLMIFHGATGVGGRVKLIQHVSQISIMLVALPRRDPSQPKRPIGFRREEHLQG